MIEMLNALQRQIALLSDVNASLHRTSVLTYIQGPPTSADKKFRSHFEFHIY